MRNNSTYHSRGIIDSTWGRVPGLHAHSEAEAILERLPTIALCFIVWGKDGLHKTMRNNSTNHSRDIIDSTWGRVPGLHAHSEAEAILEQRLPYLSNDCSLFHCVRQGWPSQDYEGNNSTNHSRGIIDSTWGRVPGLHAYSEAEAILEQRLLFVSLCEARMAFTRLWGIIVRIIPEASLTAPEDECLACMLTRKRRPYLSNDCSLFHCVRQGWPSQDYEE